MAHRRRSREQWRRLVEGWSHSGLTQQGYCDRHGISLGSLRRWRQIFREERESGITVDATLQEPARLVPVELIDGDGVEAEPLTLVLTEGMRIEIAPDFDALTLKRLLGVLREAA